MLSIVNYNSHSIISKSNARISVSALFFLEGLCFATWGARIPAIQQQLGLSEAQLGSALFVIPIGLILSMPLTSWLISRIGTKRMLEFSILLYGFALFTLGMARTTPELVAALFLFGLTSNAVNTTVNTQAVAVESLYGKSIMASFHGTWSTGGFTGAALGTLMIGMNIAPSRHFIFIFVAIFFGSLFSFRFLVPDFRGEANQQPIFAWPGKDLLQLGLIAFCSMTCEGAMFDWSGVYFKKVVLAQHAMVGVGYTAFMSTMAGTRFVADRFLHKFGLKRVLQFSGSLAATGYLIAVLFAYLITATIGFLLIGSGVSAVIPFVFGAAGRSTKVHPSTAIAAVSTIGFIGFLVAPPLIGWIAQLTSLRISFLVIASAGLSIPFIARNIDS
jgi:MFS family permease